jgi:hypothetical protein
MASFDIVLTTSGSLHPDGEPDRFISAYTGLILCTRDRDGEVFKVGKVKAYRIHTDLARQAGESVFDVCDAHSQGMQEVYAALFDPATDHLREPVRDQIDGFDADVLVLDYVLLSPRWRGLKLGLLAARKLIDLLGGGCGLAVSWVYPLHPDADEFRKVPAGWIPQHPGLAIAVPRAADQPGVLREEAVGLAVGVRAARGLQDDVEAGHARLPVNGTEHPGLYRHRAEGGMSATRAPAASRTGPGASRAPHAARRATAQATSNSSGPARPSA